MHASKCSELALTSSYVFFHLSLMEMFFVLGSRHILGEKDSLRLRLFQCKTFSDTIENHHYYKSITQIHHAHQKNHTITKF
jgi:hypothetical protein